MHHRPIPSSSELLPAIGLGTWKAFDVSPDEKNVELTAVLIAYSDAGATLIDTSPMYGKAEKKIGELTSSLDERDAFFYASKVWVNGQKQGIQQMNESLQKMQRQHIDLMQIHNLLDWKAHLPVLKEWKQEGKIRYIGITHYTDSMHAELENLMRKEQVDFVQFNYSIASRNAEKSLLPCAADCGVATLINRPLGEGNLMRDVTGKKLPEFALEWGIKSWSEYFLLFLLAHPAVTCVIPATSNPIHAKENLQAGITAIPDEKMRKKMLDYFLSL